MFSVKTAFLKKNYFTMPCKFQYTISLNKLSFVCAESNLVEKQQKICIIDDQN